VPGSSELFEPDAPQGAERSIGAFVCAPSGGYRGGAPTSPADGQDRDRVAALAAVVQGVTGEPVEPVYVDQGCTGDDPDGDAASREIRPAAVRGSGAKGGFVLPPRRRSWSVRSAGRRDPGARHEITRARARPRDACIVSHPDL
jgi:hypothetical protein